MLAVIIFTALFHHVGLRHRATNFISLLLRENFIFLLLRENFTSLLLREIRDLVDRNYNCGCNEILRRQALSKNRCSITGLRRSFILTVLLLVHVFFFVVSFGNTVIGFALNPRGSFVSLIDFLKSRKKEAMICFAELTAILTDLILVRGFFVARVSIGVVTFAFT
jgi:hypothetical protein